ncbi:MAG: hypothetical protein HZA50_01885 [Planctomycetes bacterium]|nr:hypothetical protein [Planctomycetota bacterium]
MAQQQGHGLKIWPLVWRLSAASLAAGAAGAYPTYALAGWPGLLSEAVACVIVAAIILVSTAFLLGQARSGPLRAAQAFAPMVMARGLVCVAAGLGLCLATPLPPRALLAWLLAFYIVTLVTESAWLIRTLRQSCGGQSARREDIRPGLPSGNESNT